MSAAFIAPIVKPQRNIAPAGVFAWLWITADITAKMRRTIITSGNNKTLETFIWLLLPIFNVLRPSKHELFFGLLG